MNRKPYALAEEAPVPSTTIVPVTVTPEAGAYLDELGKRPTYVRLLQHIPLHYSGVRGITVTLGYDYEGDRPPQVLFEVARGNPDPFDRADQAWARWVIAHFPPQEFEHFVVLWHPA